MAKYEASAVDDNGNIKTATFETPDSARVPAGAALLGVDGSRWVVGPTPAQEANRAVSGFDRASGRDWTAFTFRGVVAPGHSIEPGQMVALRPDGTAVVVSPKAAEPRDPHRARFTRAQVRGLQPRGWTAAERPLETAAVALYYAAAAEWADVQSIGGRVTVVVAGIRGASLCAALLENMRPHIADHLVLDVEPDRETKPTRPRAAVGQRWKNARGHEGTIDSFMGASKAHVVGQRIGSFGFDFVDLGPNDEMPPEWTYVGEAGHTRPTLAKMGPSDPGPFGCHGEVRFGPGPRPSFKVDDMWQDIATGQTWWVQEIDEGRGRAGCVKLVRTNGSTLGEVARWEGCELFGGHGDDLVAFRRIETTEPRRDMTSWNGTYSNAPTVPPLSLDDIAAASEAMRVIEKIRLEEEEGMRRLLAPKLATPPSPSCPLSGCAPRAPDGLGLRRQRADFLREVIALRPTGLDERGWLAAVATSVESVDDSPNDPLLRSMTPDQYAVDVEGDIRADAGDVSDAYQRARGERPAQAGGWKGRWNAARERAR